jgi:glycosyltransferase involved in cell wall biosynthesis
MPRAARDPVKIVCFDEAVAFGGSVVVLAHLFNHIDRSRYVPKLVTSLDEASIRLLFKEEDILHRFRPPLDYSSRAQWMQKIPSAPALIRKCWAYLFTIAAFFLNAPEYLRLLWRIRRFKPDLVHANNGREGPRFSRILNIPMVWHLHGISGNFVRTAYRADEKDAKFICISRYISSELMAQGVERERIFDVPNPAPLPTSDVSGRDEWRAQHNIRGDCVVFAHVGRLVRWKGQLEFLKAFHRTAADCPNALALIVGADAEKLNNDYPEELRQFVAENGLSERVIFTGHVSNIVQVMSYCEVVVHSSIEPEPFGLVITEAMSVGAAVVAANLGAPVEIIDDNETGFLIDPVDVVQFSDVLSRLAQDGALRARLGNAAKEMASRRYAPQTFARQVESVYDVILPDHAHDR